MSQQQLFDLPQVEPDPVSFELEVKIRIKNRPEGIPGLTGSAWVLKEPQPLHITICALAVHLLRLYEGAGAKPEEITGELSLLVDELVRLKRAAARQMGGKVEPDPEMTREEIRAHLPKPLERLEDHTVASMENLAQMYLNFGNPGFSARWAGVTILRLIEHTKNLEAETERLKLAKYQGKKSL